ncbi:MAG: molybdenum cofactor biosynthesis protein MoaE [Verrucomicrobia bacterium]|nr:molybdenum cofactor biosynthesis protein MoaE [Verrucomicrobiota bacterium]
MNFSLTAQPLDPASLQATLADTHAGACVTFEGWVRSRNEGQEVRSLEYEAFVPLAEAEGTRILAEAREKFGLIGCVATHRVGHLQLGELAVWVGVSAAHRDAAFEACRYIIDETKARVPIWKKEHYQSGSTAWLNCATKGEFGGSGGGPGPV